MADDKEQKSQEPKPRVQKKSAEQIKAEKAYVLGKKFVNEYDVISIPAGFYQYKTGLWEEISPKEMFSWINTSYVDHFEPTTKGQINEVIRNLEAETYVVYGDHLKALEKNPIKNTINLKSKILEINTFKLKDYDYTDFAFYKLKFDHTKKHDIREASNFIRFVSTSMDFGHPADAEGNIDMGKLTEEEVLTLQFIQEWMGYSLMQGNRLHKNLIMIGEGRNGKGVFADVWKAMVGEKNASDNDLSSINNTQTIHLTRDKLINFAYDLGAGQQLDTGVVKSATSGETVMSNEKYKDPYFFTFTAKLIILCNDMPYIKNTGFAIRERFYVLPFTKCFTEDERDPDLKGKIIEKELGIIFNWAVEGLKRLLTRGKFLPPERCLLSMDRYILDNDTVKFWILEENMKLNGGNAIKACVLYKYYKDFCINSNLRPIGMNNFYKDLETKGYNKILRNGARGFEGLKKPINAPEDCKL